MGDILLQYGREADKLAKDAAEQNRRLNKSQSDCNRENVGKKTPVIGSLDLIVETNGNYGFFSAVLASYNNHWALRTCPEDWWYTIIYKIALAIDANSARKSVRQFFVAHKGKKKLTVAVEPSKTVSTIDYNWFLDEMTSQIADNIKVPRYVDILKANFSTSTSIHVINSQVVVMASLQEYFEYQFGFMCGIPALEMEGELHDWIQIKDKFQMLQNLLTPIRDVIGIKESWWTSVKNILDRLIETYNGNPDVEWWSHIFSKGHRYGSGLRTNYGGWFISDFLGLKGIENLNRLQNGIITVPMTIRSDSVDEATVFLGGIAGYHVFKNENGNHQTWDSVKAAHGWALLLEPNSVFGD